MWVNCNGSIMMSLNNPEPPMSEEQSEKRREGRAFHELAEVMLKNGTVDMPEMVGKLSSHNTAYTDEMYEAAQLYAEDVFTTCTTVGRESPASFEVEERIPLDHVFPGMYGFIDAWTQRCNENGRDREIILWEAKYGHKQVEVFENWQLILYAWGIVRRIGYNGFTDKFLKIRMRVVQPRSFHGDGPIREWVITLDQLRAQFNTIKAAAEMVFHPDARFRTGAHCGSCRGRHACGTLQANTYEAMDHLGDSSGVPLSGHSLSVEYKKLKQFEELVKARLSGLNAQLSAEIESGVPGHLYTGKMGYGNKKWSAPREEILAIGDMYEIDLKKDVEVPLITPTQAMKKGVDESVISAYSTRSQTGIKLVEINDAKTRHIFNNVNK